jgi:serine/threonine protein kinase
MTVLYTIYHTKDPPKITKHLSLDLRDFISRCMKIDPRERWNVYQLLRHPFITGDASVSPLQLENNEYENKFFSEDKNTRYIHYLFIINIKKYFFIEFMTLLDLLQIIINLQIIIIIKIF